jgi:hypothetical protein
MSVAEAFGDVALDLARIAPEKIINLKASPQLSARLNSLIVRKKDDSLTADEQTELNQFLALDLFMGLTKARARLLLAQ